MWFLAQVSIVALAMLYLIAELAHHNDTAFGKSLISRTVIWLGLTMSCIPMILVHVDFEQTIHLENYSQSSSAMQSIWLLLIFVQGVYVFAICPLMIVFYESNERLTIVRRIIKSLKTQMPVFVSIILFIILTAFFARDVWIPEKIA